MSKTKILYVEDEPFLAKIVMETLQSRSYEVSHISEGGEALTAFDTFQPDLCVLDVMLPQVDGFTIGAEIRARAPHVPIIYLTAKSQTEDLLKGFATGGNDYVKKPFSMEELMARMENLLALTRGTQPKQTDGSLSIGKYQFDADKLELRLADHTRKLSHRETELLRMLVHHSHQTISRKDILQQIWGDDSFFNSRTLDVYIAKLRDYLKADENVRIITLKGVGYRVVME